MREIDHEDVEGFANTLIRSDGHEIICLGKADLKEALEEFRQKVIDDLAWKIASDQVVSEASHHCPSYHPVTFTRRILEAGFKAALEI